MRPPSPHVARARRPLWRVALGIVLLGIGALMLLGRLVTLAGIVGVPLQQLPGPAYLAGLVLGAFLTIVLPIAIGVLLVAMPGGREGASDRDGSQCSADRQRKA